MNVMISWHIGSARWTWYIYIYIIYTVKRAIKVIYIEINWFFRWNNLFSAWEEWNVSVVKADSPQATASDRTKAETDIHIISHRKANQPTETFISVVIYVLFERLIIKSLSSILYVSWVKHSGAICICIYSRRGRGAKLMVLSVEHFHTHQHTKVHNIFPFFCTSALFTLLNCFCTVQCKCDRFHILLFRIYRLVFVLLLCLKVLW